MKEKPLQVLLVEDNAGDVRLLREMFSNGDGDDFQLTHLLRMSEAETHLAKGGVDIVLLDLGLPDGHGVETVRRAHAAAPEVPVIVLTGLDDEALAAEAMNAGAQDYLIKGQIENRALPRALRHAIERRRMQTEADLIRTQQLQFKDEFLSHVSHELRSPLTAVRQFVTILLDGLAGELNPEQREYLEVTLRNVKQLQSMIDDLFEVTGGETGKLRIALQCTSASDSVVYAVNTLQGAAAAKGITLSSDVERELPSIYADPTRVRQILVILIDNAIKFTPANGTVKVQVHVLKEDPNRVVMEVSDSGAGIKPEMADRIFERLFQAADPGVAGRKGLGLGLFICKDLVARQAGNIGVKSAPGEGAVFSVTFPIFSLPNVFASTLEKEDHTESPITLVVVEVGSRKGGPSTEKLAEQCRKIGELLQGCLRSNLDVLLPKMDSPGPTELFFIVAITDKVGGEAISKRIRILLHGYVQQTGLSLSTSYRSLASIKRNPTESMGDFREKVIENIREFMNEEISLRTVKHGF
jgi:signal transduction histidine kinase